MHVYSRNEFTDLHRIIFRGEREREREQSTDTAIKTMVTTTKPTERPKAVWHEGKKSGRDRQRETKSGSEWTSARMICHATVLEDLYWLLHNRARLLQFVFKCMKTEFVIIIIVFVWLFITTRTIRIFCISILQKDSYNRQNSTHLLLPITLTKRLLQIKL